MMVQLVVYGLLMFTLLVWVLLPLAPAILIYKLFPETLVNIAGEILGLTLKASGAFAGYIAIFWLISGQVQLVNNFLSGWLHPSWRIEGKLSLIDKDKKELHSQSHFREALFRTQPDMYSFNDPTFFLYIPEYPTGIPAIVIDIPNFGYFYKDKYAPDEIDWFNKTIRLKDSVKIEEIPRNASDLRSPDTVPAASPK